jgi:hypothetical protein
VINSMEKDIRYIVGGRGRGPGGASMVLRPHPAAWSADLAVPVGVLLLVVDEPSAGRTERCAGRHGTDEAVRVVERDAVPARAELDLSGARDPAVAVVGSVGDGLGVDLQLRCGGPRRNAVEGHGDPGWVLRPRVVARAIRAGPRRRCRNDSLGGVGTERQWHHNGGSSTEDAGCSGEGIHGNLPESNRFPCWGPSRCGQEINTRRSRTYFLTTSILYLMSKCCLGV